MNGLEVDQLQRTGTLKVYESPLAGHYEAKGMQIEMQCYNYDGCAAVTTMHIRAMGGLMKMESLVLTPYAKDAPLMSFDYIKVLGNHKMYMELFDTQLAPLALDGMDEVKRQFADLKDAKVKPHWYDYLHLSPTSFKTGWGKRDRKMQLAHEMLDAYVEVMKGAPACDPAAKRAKNEAYVNGLLEHGGPAVDTMRARMGTEKGTAIIKGMFFAGVEES